MADGPGNVTAIVLAAGAGTRFGGGKLLASFGGRPILQHVLDTLAEARIDDVVVVLGADADAIEQRIDWRGERRLVNPAPEDGLAGSLRIGMSALPPDPGGALVVLGDQPLLRSSTIRTLLDAPADPARPVVVPRYVADRGRNPVLLRPAAFGLADEAAGDRGLGPVLAAHPEFVTEVAAEGDNPDIDAPGDLAALVERSWAERVRANRDQVDRVREVPDGKDFYAPVTGLFVADPRRTDEPVLDALRALAAPGETWLDIGAGAGRYALPLALVAGRVIALDPSRGMLDALRDGMAEHGIANVEVVEGRWPPAPDDPVATALGPFPVADVALIAHVGYDVEEIGPFVAAMEEATRRLCVAVLMERQPASLADPVWPPVHGETRVALPALPAFLELLRARGREPELRTLEREARRFATRDELEGFLRRQLWVAEGGPKDARFRSAVDDLATEDERGWYLRGVAPMGIGIATWSPGGN